MKHLIAALLLICSGLGLACSPEVLTENSVPESLQDYAASLYNSSDYVMMVHISRIETVEGLEANDVYFTVLSQIKGAFLEEGVVRIRTSGCPSELVELGDMRLMFLTRDKTGSFASVHRDPKFASYSETDVAEALLRRK